MAFKLESWLVYHPVEAGEFLAQLTRECNFKQIQSGQHMPKI